MNVASDYRVTLNGKSVQVPAPRAELARELDQNKDGLVDSAELRARCTLAAAEEDYATFLSGQPHPQDDLYPTLPEVEQQLHDWAEQHPDTTRLVSLGKTHENRDIWALRISRGDQEKPGVLFTGTTHAREWNTLSTTMNVARQLIEGDDPQSRRLVEEGEVWVVPVLNPDGFHYSRETDPNWRKNRSPYAPQQPERQQDPPPEPPAPPPMGVDLNRNYWDGKPDHFRLYRPEGDKPADTSDDSGPGYDDPASDNYRGPSGASEPEVQAVLQYFVDKPNIRGVIDHHSYGKDIFYPVAADDPAAQPYQEVAAAMNAAMETPYKVVSYSNIPIPVGYFSGVAPFTWNANGKMAILLEMGTQFQPGHDELDPTVRDVTAADLAFADYVLDHAPPRN